MDCPIGKRAWHSKTELTLRIQLELGRGVVSTGKTELVHRLLGVGVGIQLGNQATSGVAVVAKEKEAKRKSARPKGLAWDTSLFLRFAQS